MRIEIHIRRIALAIFLLVQWGRLSAQWNFLGDPLISTTAVTSQSLALSPTWNPHLAYTSGGTVKVTRFDGNDWLDLPVTNLPGSGVTACALTFSPAGDAYLALAPGLGVYYFDGLAWQSIPGLPTVSNAQGLQMRCSTLGKLWLTWFKAGATDTTYIYSRLPSSNWVLKGALEGRVIDMELDDLGQPLVLKANATTIYHFTGGIWQPLPIFSHLDEDYIAFQMSYDGTSTGCLVLRQDSSQHLSVESLVQGSWMQYGVAGFATGGLSDLGLSFSGIPHVLSVDHANDGPPQAFQFVAGGWQLLGGQFVYNNTVSQPQLAFDPAAAYVVFRDDEQNLRNSVMYLGTPSGNSPPAPANTLRLWPNPVMDELHVELERPFSHSRVSITDAMGRVVHSEPVPGGHSFSLDVRTLPAGHYFIFVHRSQLAPLRGSFAKYNSN